MKFTLISQSRLRLIHLQQAVYSSVQACGFYLWHHIAFQSDVYPERIGFNSLPSSVQGIIKLEDWSSCFVGSQLATVSVACLSIICVQPTEDFTGREGLLVIRLTSRHNILFFCSSNSFLCVGFHYFQLTKNPSCFRSQNSTFCENRCVLHFLLWSVSVSSFFSCFHFFISVLFVRLFVVVVFFVKLRQMKLMAHRDRETRLNGYGDFVLGGYLFKYRERNTDLLFSPRSLR